MSGALVLVISPIMTILWIVSSLALLVYNLMHKKFGRGFYQLLATLFGVLLVGYTAAYYALNAQILYTSLEQSIVIPFMQLGFSQHFLMNLAEVLVFSIIFGLFTNFIHGIHDVKVAGEGKIWHIFLLIGTVFAFVLVVFSKTFEITNLLALLPLTLSFVSDSIQEAVDNKESIFKRYLQSKLFAPVVALIFVIAMPFVYAIANHSMVVQEKLVAQYVKADTSTSDGVFALAPNKNVNLLSGRVSTSDYVPAYYPLKFQQTFDLNIAQAKNKYLVIQKGEVVPDSITETLKASYKAVKVDDLDKFMVYIKK
jgi:hypothetical protein